MVNLDKQSLEQLLQSRFENDEVKSLSSLPPPDIFENIFLAANRVKSAIKQQEKIVIVGDYDVDGVTSAAILSIFFNIVGADYEVILPNRFTDGYGLNPQIAKRVNANLVITVDNGIAAIEAAKECALKNMQLIIIDHHSIGEELPAAYAIVHPSFSSLKQKQISAGLVVWYFVAALKKCFEIDFDMKSLLDIAALSTVADVMPLTDINRVIVKAGMSAFKNSNAPYVLAFKEMLKKDEITAFDIAFRLAPRLNCAGRLEDATLAYDFLMSKTLNEARGRLLYLDNLNEERKKVENSVLTEALTQIDENAKAVVVYGKEWNEGVVGIVAGKLAEKFSLPTFAISVNNDDAKGSARAPKGYNLYEMMSSCKEIFTKFGGHKLAAGFSLKTKDIEDFNKKIQQFAVIVEDVPSIVLGKFKAKELDLKLHDLITQYEPYGEGNSRPIFYAKDICVKSVNQVGKQMKFTKMVVDFEGYDFEILHKEDVISFYVGQNLELYYSISRNDFNGTSKIQLKIEKLL